LGYLRDDALQDYLEREYALAKQQTESSRPQTAASQPDDWAMLAYHQKLGQNGQSKTAPAYDNGNGCLRSSVYTSFLRSPTMPIVEMANFFHFLYLMVSVII
jgi:hypothetical protein